MIDTFAATRPNQPMVLSAWGLRAVSAQVVLLVSAAFLLPAAAHAAGLPVRWLLPMHWPVMLAGLCYGWRSGAAVGLAAPGVSFLLSGHPLPAVLPSMTLELATYGALAGFGCEILRLHRVVSTLAAALGGRLVFVLTMLATGGIVGPIAVYLQAAILPGLPAVVGQIAVLPVVAKWWVHRENPKGGASRTRG
jgi:niacin transporter